jgi:hypothetical protein
MSHYEHLRQWEADGFRLDLWDTGRCDRMGKSILRYALFDETQPLGKGIVFEGEDFHCSPCHAIDSDETVEAVLDFLSLEQGDTDREYFAAYSPVQLAWRDRRANDLKLAAMALADAREGVAIARARGEE